MTRSTFAVAPGKACARLFSNVIGGLFSDEIGQPAKVDAYLSFGHNPHFQLCPKAASKESFSSFQPTDDPC